MGSVETDRPALAVMVRTATPGRVKTRLAERIGDREAAAVYRTLREDTRTRAAASGVPAALYLAVEPRSGDETPGALDADPDPSWSQLEQRGADLGSRLAGVFADLFAAGHDPVVIVGSDSPALPSPFLRKAFALLRPGVDEEIGREIGGSPGADLVLGPAFDGGYYLIGTTRATWRRSGDGLRTLLRDSPLGTPRAAAFTRTGARALGLRVRDLPLWMDVDELPDLRQAAGLLPHLEGSPATPPPARAAASGRLRELYLHVTHRCGTGCPQCYLRDARDPGLDRSRELGTSEWKAVVDQAVSLGATTFVIIGGDPFLRPDLLTLLEHVAGVHGAAARLFFNRPVGAETAQDLARAGHGRLVPLLSIDGTETVNDSLRGAGNFADARASIRALLEAGLRPVVNTVMLGPVLPTLPDFARELAREGVSALHLILPHERGGLSDRADLIPTGDELLSALRALEASAGEVGVAIDNLAAWKSRLRTPRDLCGAGCDLLAVDPEGLVHACPITCGDQGFVAGDLRERSLADIWRDSPSLGLLRATHARDREACRECPVVDACGGECWVQAHYAAVARGERAGYLAPFPYCGLVRPVLEGLGAGRGPGDGDPPAVDLTPFDCI